MAGKRPGTVGAESPTATQAVQLSNAQLRTLFLGSAIRKSQVLQGQALTAGGSLSWDLPSAGVAERVRLLISGTITPDATNGGTPSAKGPASLLPRIRFQDYSGIDRCNASGYMLYNLDIAKRFNWDPSISGPVTEAYNATVWNWPTGVQKAVFNVAGYVDVPLAFGRTDPRGTLSLEVSNGKCQLFISAPAAIGVVGNSDAPVNLAAGGSITASNLTITPVYYYWEPVSVKIGGHDIVPIPSADLALIHELVSSQDGTNLAPGVEKLTTLPTGRDYYRILHSLVYNNALDTADLTQIRYLYNGSTPTTIETLQAYLSRVRENVGRDLPVGTVLFDFTGRPWDSLHWGQLQTGLTLAATANNNPGAPTYLETLRESLYTADMIAAQ